MIGIPELSVIGNMIARMNQYSLYRPRMYDAVLSELMKLCDIGGMAHIMRVDVAGQMVGKPAHVNSTHPEIPTDLAPYTRKSNFKMDPTYHALQYYLQHCSELVGFAAWNDLQEINDRQLNEGRENGFSVTLARDKYLDELGYLWIKVSNQYTWVICLKQNAGAGPITKYQRDLLTQYGYTAYGSLDSWYIPAFDALDASCNLMKDKLTVRQYETLYHLSCYCSRKECAKMMGVGRNTIDRNIENLLKIFRENFIELEGKTISQIIRSLKGH